MKIEQFENKGLAHYSYAVFVEDANAVVLVDPGRNPQPYFDYAAANEAKIVAIIETHPHADFVSSHLEIHHKKGAKIYTHSLVGAGYPHEIFDDGAVLRVGSVKLKSLHTPGHSPDSISIVLECEGEDKAVFTGDTLFIGDVGRPDLRESAGNVKAKREELARQMYKSTREKLMKLDGKVKVYPSHGAGTLCGKAVSDANSSTIAAEKLTNYALQQMSEDDFVKILTADQPFVPKYFGYDVELNKKGAPPLEISVNRIKKMDVNFEQENSIVVDTRFEKLFKSAHFRGAINIQNGMKFETWLGAIIAPEERFYLVAETDEKLDEVIQKAAKIGYELLIQGAIVLTETAPLLTSSPVLDVDDFRYRQEDYTIVDVRNGSELRHGSFFDNVLHIPLPELRERVEEVPTDKPVVVHCAGGYRSAAGSSILDAALPDTIVFDLGDSIKSFKILSEADA